MREISVSDRTADLESRRISLMFEARGLCTQARGLCTQARGLCTQAQNSLAADQIKKGVKSVFSLQNERSMNFQTGCSMTQQVQVTAVADSIRLRATELTDVSDT
jgi:hypothetical protein